MYKQLSFIVYCASLGLIVLMSTTLQSDFNIDVKSIPQNQDTNQFEDAIINAYADTTHLLYKLSSPIVSYRQDTGFEFEQPEFIYKSSGIMPLHLSATKGYMENNSALIELAGDVKLFHLNPKNDMPEYLYTSNATIDLNSKQAYTDDKATFKQHEKLTEGVGMIADLEAQTIKLKSKIRVLNAF